jgi:DNA-directed RNA polymerase subunit M/transcription elongation factor TFIIS
MKNSITAISSVSASCPKCGNLMVRFSDRDNDYLKCQCSETRYKAITVELEVIK